jgi:RNA polymerase sigma-70 factor (ECF subfamily)
MLRRDPLSNPRPLIKRVYAYVAYRIGDGPDAEDVTSEVFERALRYRDTFDPRKGEPVAWLLGIARRCIRDARVPSAKERPAEHVDEADTRDLERDVVRRVDLTDALRRLTERERDLVALRYGADLTARQIGELLDLSTNAVEVALSRALRRLQGELEPASDEDDEGASEPVRV